MPLTAKLTGTERAAENVKSVLNCQKLQEVVRLKLLWRIGTVHILLGSQQLEW